MIAARLLSTFLAVGLLSSLAPAAFATPVASAAGCGQTLTSDAYLATDLTCAAGQGLTIAGAVRLDLRGHTLRGPGAGVLATGITVRDGVLTLTNGTVSGWGVGIAPGVTTDPNASPKASVTGVLISNNKVGASTEDASGNWRMPYVIDQSQVNRNETGLITGIEVGSYTVTRTRFSHNTRYGIRMGYLAGLTVSTSTFDFNRAGIACDDSSCDISANRFLNNGTGISGFTGSLDARHNYFVHNVYGISATGTLAANSSNNWFASNRTGILLTRAGGTIADNRFTTNGVGLRAANAGSSSAFVIATGNSLRANGSGIIIDSDPSSVELGTNSAFLNKTWGINAPGAIDLGGNRAGGNGTEPQCVGVTCSA